MVATFGDWLAIEQDFLPRTKTEQMFLHVVADPGWYLDAPMRS